VSTYCCELPRFDFGHSNKLDIASVGIHHSATDWRICRWSLNICNCIQIIGLCMQWPVVLLHSLHVKPGPSVKDRDVWMRSSSSKEGSELRGHLTICWGRARVVADAATLRKCFRKWRDLYSSNSCLVAAHGGVV
jgi:hypothetical protein